MIRYSQPIKYSQPSDPNGATLQDDDVKDYSGDGQTKADLLDPLAIDLD